MFINLFVHTDFSFDSTNKPSKIVKKCKKYGADSVAITELHSISSSIAFYKACISENIKPILGCELNIKEGELSYSLIVLCKNKQAWEDLIGIISHSHKHSASPKDIPYIELSDFLKLSSGNFIILSGYPGSKLHDILFTDVSRATVCKDYNECRELVRSDWREALTNEVDIYKKNFHDVYLACQLIDQENQPSSLIATKIFRHISSSVSVECVAVGRSHYLNKEDASDQRILLCSKHKLKLKDMVDYLGNAVVTDSHYKFFSSNNYYLWTTDEISKIHTPEEIANTVKISNKCDEFSILSKPKLPKFKCPDGLTEEQYFDKLCRLGLERIGKANDKVYLDRYLEEKEVFKNAGLFGYFLIVQDYLNYARELGYIVGKSRGSVGGCLSAYLMRITGIDPIIYGLYLSRFYNSSRNIPDKISFKELTYEDFISGNK